MSTVLDEPRSGQSTSPAQRLRTTMAAVRVSFMWLGVRKTLTAEQKAEATIENLSEFFQRFRELNVQASLFMSGRLTDAWHRDKNERNKV